MARNGKQRLTVDRSVAGGKIRYVKMYKGQRFKSRVYDRETRDNEREAWTAYLNHKEKVESDIAEANKPDDYLLREFVAEKLDEQAAYCRLINQEESARYWDQFKLALPKATERQVAQAAEVLVTGHNPKTGEWTYTPDQLKLISFIVKQAVQHDSDPTFNTLALAEQWLGFREGDVSTGTITAGTLDNNRRQLNILAAFCPDIRSMDGIRFQEFRKALQARIKNGESSYTHRDTIGTVKTFLEWCSDTRNVIPAIPALRKRGSGIRIPTKKIIRTWCDDAVADLLQTVSGRQKLYYLLVLNTGAYESDIGTWTKRQTNEKGKEFMTFDKKRGTLTFKRHKERNTERVPTVTYKLWPTTMALLLEHISDDRELLLTSERGTALWIDESKVQRNSKMIRKRKNLIGRQFGRLRKDHPNWGTLEDLRKTAISKLDDHSEFARYSQYFAGHSPIGTTDRFYRKPSQTQFDAALDWLGQQFGQVPLEESETE